MNFNKLTFDEIKLDEIFQLVKSPNCGAVSFFLGTTRDNSDGQEVVCLEYEAHEEMALKEMEKICSQIRKEWPSVVNIAMFHRLGQVDPTEAGVAIAISSPHRKESLEGVNFAINALKEMMPILKKEVYKDKPPVWNVNKESKWAK